MTPSEALALLDEFLAAEAAYKVARERIKEGAPDIFRAVRAVEGDISQRELARRLKADYTYISRVEGGHVRPFKPTLEKMAQILRGKVG